MVELVITCIRGVLIIRLLEQAVSESTVDGDKKERIETNVKLQIVNCNLFVICLPTDH